MSSMADTETFTPDLSAFVGVLGGDPEQEQKDLAANRKKRKKEKKQEQLKDMEPQTFDLSAHDVTQKKFKRKMKKFQEKSEDYQKFRQVSEWCYRTVSSCLLKYPHY